ncbi:helix-turn-helix domain-containing protein [Arthrobacter sp. ok362]|uniref:helix-turn-helix domain-containing protein n=1 Tax=Arthrobacter sp. ok362 TaxID=1761745 RepID=UPI000B86D83B|nr:helix-turn-helix domain-containing protein [Arthrobacter sp. ok362]
MEITRSIYVTRAEAAVYLNVPPRWLANNTKSGPRYIKVGGLVRYSVEALDAFMSAHEGRH